MRELAVIVDVPMSRATDQSSSAGVSLVRPSSGQTSLSDLVVSDVGPCRSEWLPDLLEELLPTTCRAVRELIQQSSPEVFTEEQLRSSFVRDVLLDDVSTESGEIDIGSADAGVALERYFNALVRYALDFDGFETQTEQWPRRKRRQRFEDIETITTIGTGRGTFNAGLPVLEHGFCRLHREATVAPTVVLLLDGDSWINATDNRTVQSALETIELLGSALDIQIVASPALESYLERHFGDWYDDVLGLTGGWDTSGVPAPVANDTYDDDLLLEAWDRLRELDSRGGRVRLLANLGGDDPREYRDLAQDDEIGLQRGTIDRYVLDLESLDLLSVDDSGRYNQVSLSQLGEASLEYISDEYAIVHPLQSDFSEPYSDPSSFYKYSVLGDLEGEEGGRQALQSTEPQTGTTEEWLATTGNPDHGDDYVQFIDGGPSKTIDAWPMHDRLAAGRRVDGINLVDHEIPEFEDGRVTYLSDMEDHTQVVTQWGGSLPTLARFAAALLSDKAFSKILEPSTIGTNFENLFEEVFADDIDSIIKRGMQVGWFSRNELEYGTFRERFTIVRSELLARLAEATTTTDCEFRSELYKDLHGLLASTTALYRALGRQVTFHIRLPNTRLLKADSDRYTDFLRFMKETVPKQMAYGIHSGYRMLLEKRPEKLRYRLPYDVQEDDPSMDTTAGWVITGPQASLLQDDLEAAIAANHSEVREQIRDGSEDAPMMEIPVASGNEFCAIKNEISRQLERKGFQTNHETLIDLTRTCMAILGTETRGPSPYDVAEAMLQLQKKPGIPLTVDQLENVLAKLPAKRLFHGQKPTVRKMVKALLEADHPMSRSELIAAAGISASSYDRNWRTLLELEAIGLIDRTAENEWSARLVPLWADIEEKTYPDTVSDYETPSYWWEIPYDALFDLGIADDLGVDRITELFSEPYDVDEILSALGWTTWRPLFIHLDDWLFEHYQGHSSAELVQSQVNRANSISVATIGNCSSVSTAQQSLEI